MTDTQADQVDETTEAEDPNAPDLWGFKKGLTPEQYAALMRPLNSTRVAKRKQGGKELSYLEAFDVRAHLIRTFGFTNFDAEVIDTALMFIRDYENNDGKPMAEIAYRVTMRLTIRDQNGHELCRFSEGAVGSASGGSGFGDLHDNALKTAASDALKRCAINLGTQFGLGLYDNGSTREVVRGTLIKPKGVEDTKPAATAEQVAMLAQSLGATPVEESA